MAYVNQLAREVNVKVAWFVPAGGLSTVRAHERRARPLQAPLTARPRAVTSR